MKLQEGGKKRKEEEKEGREDKKEGGRKRRATNPKEKRVNSDSITFPIPGLQAGIHLTQSLPLESSPAVTHR